MSDLMEIQNLINLYHQYFANKEEGKIEALLTSDCSFTADLFGTQVGKSDIKVAIEEQMTLPFLSEVVQVPSGHAITLVDDTHASAHSYSTTYYKCTPVLLTLWEDQLIKVDGRWLFQQRVCTDVQKNFELLGDMQLKGKKSYAS